MYNADVCIYIFNGLDINDTCKRKNVEFCLVLTTFYQVSFLKYYAHLIIPILYCNLKFY